MKFRTEIDQPSYPFNIGYSNSIVFVGSCFAESVGREFDKRKFEVLVNPSGVLYNPFSVADAIESFITNDALSDDDCIYANGLWHSFKHHGSFSSLEKTELIQSIIESRKYANSFLRKTDVLFLTFGTAWVYEFKSTGKIVSNCHKINASEFTRRKLTITEIVERWKSIIIKLKTFATKPQIIFTVSPVRYLKDTAHGSQLSKAVLLLAIEELCNEFDCVHYFPSYEILLDELRDYRFYSEDLIHPSEVTIKYIFEVLTNSIFDKDSKTVMAEVEKVLKGFNHRPLQGNQSTLMDFRKKLIEQMNHLNQRHNINFAEEILTLKKLTEA